MSSEQVTLNGIYQDGKAMPIHLREQTVANLLVHAACVPDIHRKARWIQKTSKLSGPRISKPRGLQKVPQPCETKHEAWQTTMEPDVEGELNDAGLPAPKKIVTHSSSLTCPKHVLGTEDSMQCAWITAKHFCKAQWDQRGPWRTVAEVEFGQFIVMKPVFVDILWVASIWRTVT